MRKKLLLLVLLFLWTVTVSEILFQEEAFAQSVDTAWVRIYNGTGNGGEWPRAMVLDSYGNIYVTGESIGSGSSCDYATIKYYPNGDTAWVRRYNGPGNSGDEAYAIAVDNSGNVYVTGQSYGSGSSSDYATIKYTSNGDTAWVRRYNGPANSIDMPCAIAVDGDGNVYVTGTSEGSGSFSDYTTIKYFSNGDTAWVRRYDGPGNLGDEAQAMAVDGSGNVYVAGYVEGSGTDIDHATVKYFPNGDTAWVRTYNGTANDDDRAYAIAVDAAGNVYVTGYTYASGTSDDYTTIKYYPNGDTAWVRTYNGPDNGWDEALAIAVDSSGNVYVSGQSQDTVSRTYDLATIKYYPNGDTAWIRRYNGPENGENYPYAIALDSAGYLYVTGYSYSYGESEDYATIKYGPEGDLIWVISYDGPANGQDHATALAVDDAGYVYVTGASSNSIDLDFATIKYVQFLRGDTNKDGKVSISDIVYIISYLFKQGPEPVPAPIVGDANCDGKVSLSDIVYLIAYLFKQGPSPCI